MIRQWHACAVRRTSTANQDASRVLYDQEWRTASCPALGSNSLLPTDILAFELYIPLVGVQGSKKWMGHRLSASQALLQQHTLAGSAQSGLQIFASPSGSQLRVTLG